MKPQALTLIFSALTLAHISSGTGEAETSTAALNYEVLPLAIDADPKTKDFLEDFLIELPKLEVKEKEITYHIRIVEPDPNIEYKILRAEPDPNINFKLRIIEPEGQAGTSKLNSELSDKLTELFEKSKEENSKE